MHKLLELYSKTDSVVPQHVKTRHKFLPNSSPLPSFFSEHFVNITQPKSPLQGTNPSVPKIVSHLQKQVGKLKVNYFSLVLD